jgi:ribonuclease P protein component
LLKSISQSRSFAFLLKTRPVAKTPRMQLFLVPIGEGQQSCLGVLVPKRFVSRAIDRHLIKRLAREAAGKKQELRFFDVLIRVVAPVKQVSFSDRTLWWQEFSELFSKL